MRGIDPILVGWFRLWFVSMQKGEGVKYPRCRRVFRMSKGWTTRVAARPAVKPAAVSIMDGERGVEGLPVSGGEEGGIVGWLYSTCCCSMHNIGYEIVFQTRLACR